MHALHPLEVRPSARLDLETHAPVAKLRAIEWTRVAGVAASSACGSSSKHRDELPDSGGPRAGHGSGASLGKSTCSSILLATRLSVIFPIGFIRPPHLPQSHTSNEKTRRINSAHRSPRSRWGAQLSAADDPTRSAALAAAIAVIYALLGGRPRLSLTTYARRLAWGARHPG